MSYSEYINTNTLQTTDATTTTILSQDLGSSQCIVHAFAKIIAQDINTGDSKWYTIFAGFKTVSGTTTQLGTNQTYGAADQPSWTVDFSITSNTLNLDVTGAASTTVNWSASLSTSIQS